MANYTEKIIMQTFETMLDEMPFGKITVSALVSRCGISSNTFYYHFKDIYDLLEVWLDGRIHLYLNQIGPDAEWKETFKNVLHGVERHSRRVYHIFNSLSRDRLERYIFTYVEQQFHDDLQRRVAGMQVDEKTLDAVSSFYCYAVLGFFLKYLWGNMKADIDTSVDALWQVFDGALTYVLQRAGKDELREPE